jgi:sec-independent protein translocase protein TatB
LFDISFSELALCFVVALVVLGPERLPKVARTLGRWSGQAKSYMRNLTAELERETNVAEIKKQFEDAERTIRENRDEVERSIRATTDDVRKNLSPEPEHKPEPAPSIPAAPASDDKPKS